MAGEEVDKSLGIRRRTPAQGSSTEGLGELGTKKETAPQQPKKPTGKLPPASLQILLNFYAGRPEVEPPQFIDELQGTSGWFCGDGRLQREIIVGFQPAFVIFTAPPFPDEGRHWKGATFYQPPLHDQPLYTDRGFIIDERFNKAGTMSMYVVWKPKEPGKDAPPAKDGAAAAKDAPAATDAAATKDEVSTKGDSGAAPAS